MGAWDSGPFDNDDALDWLGALEDGEAREVVDAALRKVVDNSGYLQAPDCSEALAAAEIVAAADKHPRAELPEESLDGIERLGLPSESLTTLAHAAVEKILACSELRDLWAETDELSAWEASVRDLSNRLRVK